MCFLFRPAYLDFTATEYRVLDDGTQRMLWQRADGMLNVWRLEGGAYVSHVEHGPHPLWEGRAYSDG